MTSDEPSPTTVPTGIPALEAATPAPRSAHPQVVLITGMSGAGRSRAAAALEDLGWYVVDNLPVPMLAPLVGMMTSSSAHGVQRLGAVIDARGRDFAQLLGELDSLGNKGVDVHIMFLDASDEVLVRRFEFVRRPHPLQGSTTVLEAIALERSLLADVRARANWLVDTSETTVHDLDRQVRQALARPDEDVVQVSVMSFGFKYGLPLDADYVADVRFLPNPYWISELRHLTGRDGPVREYVMSRTGAETFVDRYVQSLEPVLAGYLREGKYYMTIAVGCTGGRHRSVAVSEQVASRLRALGHRVSVQARDIDKE
ncbi:MAG: RNase adapter RapZ [Micrococcales bacterium]|nr:RNase adapter RapZ [Micrococcales bacterium]MCL2666720.1 RNase adapter RapZ [Micrococcales bacterium]